MANISRQAYAEMLGPTVGDRVRLADTELWLEVEKDFTVYGDEVKFGGGKVIRDAGPMNAGSTIIAFLEDPDGYQIELIGADRHRKASDADFNDAQ